MFDTVETPSLWSWWWRYLAQFLLCYPVVWIASLALSPFVSLIGLGNWGRIHFVGYESLLLFCVAAVLGRIAFSQEPSLRSSGQWIWVLPVLALVGDIVQNLRRPIPWPTEPLFSTPGGGGLGPILIGMPAFAAAGYSAGMMLAARGKQADSAVPHTVVVGFGLFVIVLSSVLYGFENVSMAKWSKVRTVSDNTGSWLAPDSKTLCANQAAGPLLRWGTYVEMLGERRACSGDLALADGDPGPPRSFIVDRVRVLNGPHAGAVGWALEYSLLEPYR